jgi:hypothetical protein
VKNIHCTDSVACFISVGITAFVSGLLHSLSASVVLPLSESSYSALSIHVLQMSDLFSGLLLMLLETQFHYLSCNMYVFQLLHSYILLMAECSTSVEDVKSILDESLIIKLSSFISVFAKSIEPKTRKH